MRLGASAHAFVALLHLVLPGVHAPSCFSCLTCLTPILNPQVEATLKKASKLRRALATNLLAAAAAYVQARRVVEGVDLQYALQVGWLGAVLVPLPCCLRTGLGLPHGCGLESRLLD